MILDIDTSDRKIIRIKIGENDEIIARAEFDAEYAQAEKLLPAIRDLLRTKGIKLSDLKKIKVANCGKSFTSLRLGVIAANALSYALDIPVSGTVKNKAADFKAKDALRSKKLTIIRPFYHQAPHITKKRSL